MRAMAAYRGLDQKRSIALRTPERSDGRDECGRNGKCEAFFADIMRPPSRAARRPARRATPHRAAPPPRLGPAGRSGRSPDLPAAPPRVLARAREAAA